MKTVRLGGFFLAKKSFMYIDKIKKLYYTDDINFMEVTIMAKANDYFGLGRLISIILAIIPFTAWILGVVTRFKEGAIIAGIIRIFGGWLIWVLDLICMLVKGSICRFLFII